MRAFNKIVPMILIVFMSMNMSGCGNSTGTNAGQPEETSTEVRSVDEGDNSDSGSSEMFSRVTVYGTKFTMPCDVNDFKGDFSVKKSKESEGFYSIIYKKERIGDLYYKDREKIDLKKDIPDSICFDYSNELNINELSGISLTYDSVLEKYNTPNKAIKDEDGKWADILYDYDSYFICLHFKYINDDLYLSSIQWILK